MSNKPLDVIKHEHFSVYSSEEIAADESLDTARYDACWLKDGTTGVWCVEHDEWFETGSFDDACRSARALAIIIRRHIEERNTNPIVPMKPGEVPREDGWYVLQEHDGERIVVTVNLRLQWVHSSGWNFEQHIDEVLRNGSTFIARIYPDRIGEE